MPLTDEERKARHREYQKRYLMAHREKANESRRKRYREHNEYREKALERSKKWREENREKRNEYLRKWYKANREAVSKWKLKYYYANIEKYREREKRYREENREHVLEYSKKRSEYERGKELKKRRDFGYLPDKENNNAKLRRYTVHLINSSFTYLAATALEACEIAAQHFGWTRIAEPETNGNDYCRYTCFSAKHDTFYITAKLKGDNK